MAQRGACPPLSLVDPQPEGYSTADGKKEGHTGGLRRWSTVEQHTISSRHPAAAGQVGIGHTHPTLALSLTHDLLRALLMDTWWNFGHELKQEKEQHTISLKNALTTKRATTYGCNEKRSVPQGSK